MAFERKLFSLEIDLSQKESLKKEIDPKIFRAFLGGQGMIAKILWDRVPPEVSPFSPDNLLIIGAGILAGTMVPGANRATVGCKSPVTNTLSWSSVGGFIASEIKNAGYENITISGKSSAPVYLWIHDDKVEIRDASHLWGKDTRETQQIIHQELNNDKIQIICIGQAGENRVNFASIEHCHGSSASRGGAGAVMGDKSLKAIAIYGTKNVTVAEPSRLVHLCDRINDRLKTTSKRYPELVYGTRDSGIFLTVGLAQEALPGYFGKTIPPEFMKEWDMITLMEKMEDYLGKKLIREVSCQNCPYACILSFHEPFEGHVFFKCQSLLAIMTTTKKMDFDFAVSVLNLCQKHGLDVISLTVTIAFATELYEKGILTKTDTDGMHLEWANPELVISLTKKIIHREGIGDILADDVYYASRRIGKAAEEYGHHIKKNTQIPWLLPSPWYGLIAAVSEKGDLTRIESAAAATYGIYQDDDLTQAMLPDKKEYLETGLTPFPEQYWKYFMADYGRADDEESIEALCQIAAYMQEMWPICDATGICSWWSIFLLWNPINRSMMGELVAAVTGLDIDEAEMIEIAKRTLSLIRAYNARAGNSRKDDRLPKIWFEKNPRGHKHAESIDPVLLERWKDRFYELRGWNNNGIPTKETLEQQGLGDVFKELKERKIL